MKRIFITLILVLVVFVVNAQIYTKIEYLDKFDDPLKTEHRKTLITKTDSTFVIEEKGKKPVEYIILDMVDNDSATKGSKEEVVNLVDNVYGYQTTWCVVRSDMYRDYYIAVLRAINENTDENIRNVASYFMYAVHRTITTQYTGDYKTEYFWLEKPKNNDIFGKGVSRIIYSMK